LFEGLVNGDPILEIGVVDVEPDWRAGASRNLPHLAEGFRERLACQDQIG